MPIQINWTFLCSNQGKLKVLELSLDRTFIGFVFSITLDET